MKPAMSSNLFCGKHNTLPLKLLFYVSVKSKLQHPPPGKPRAFDFFENYCSNSPLPGPKCRLNAPH